MAVEPSRLRPHIYLPGQGQAQRYTAHPAGGGEGGESRPATAGACRATHYGPDRGGQGGRGFAGDA